MRSAFAWLFFLFHLCGVASQQNCRIRLSGYKTHIRSFIFFLTLDHAFIHQQQVETAVCVYKGFFSHHTITGFISYALRRNILTLFFFFYPLLDVLWFGFSVICTFKILSMKCRFFFEGHVCYLEEALNTTYFNEVYAIYIYIYFFCCCC